MEPLRVGVSVRGKSGVGRMNRAPIFLSQFRHRPGVCWLTASLLQLKQWQEAQEEASSGSGCGWGGGDRCIDRLSNRRRLGDPIHNELGHHVAESALVANLLQDADEIARSRRQLGVHDPAHLQ